MVAKLTKAQLIEQHRDEVHMANIAGVREGRQQVNEEFARRYDRARLEQLQAAAKLMEEAGRIMSRAGYMIGKINGDNSR